MGKKSKLLIVAICFIIIGVILLAIGYVAGGYENIVKKYADNDNLVYINKELDSFEDLDITLQYGDVEIIKFPLENKTTDITYYTADHKGRK